MYTLRRVKPIALRLRLTSQGQGSSECENGGKKGSGKIQLD